MPDEIRRGALEDWRRFVVEQSHVFKERPGLFFQQAANEPDATAPARAAAQRQGTGLERRPWLRWINKPQRRSACLITITGHTSDVSACAWSPDGTRIVSGSKDRTLRMWDAASGAELARLTGHEYGVGACSWSPDGTRIASASGDWTVRVWDVASGAPLATLAGHGYPQAFAWSPDWKLMASASDDRNVKVRDAVSGAELATLTGHADWVGGCAWSPDGTRVASASADGTVKVWEAASAVSLLTLSGHTDTVGACAWSPDGTRIASASMDQTFKVWDASGRAAIATLAGHTHNVLGCAWSPDGTRIACGSNDKTARIWDATGGTEVETLASDSAQVGGCAWSPDGTRIACVLWGTVKAWEAASQAEVTRFGHALRVFDPDGGAEQITLAAHTETVETSAWSPDGSRLAFASRNRTYVGTIQVWDARSGSALATLTCRAVQPPTWVWSPEGARIASASLDGTVAIWDAAGAVLLCEYPAFGEGNVLAWTPATGRIVVGTRTGAIHVLQLENLPSVPPVVTAWLQPQVTAGPQAAEPVAAIGCPVCRAWSEIPASALGSEGPCPNCGERLSLNSFTVNADWRPIARAWRGGPSENSK